MAKVVLGSRSLLLVVPRIVYFDSIFLGGFCLASVAGGGYMWNGVWNFTLSGGGGVVLEII